MTVTDNSSSMVSVRVTGTSVQLRLHRIFLAAGSDVVDELAGFILNQRRETPLLRGFIRSSRGLVKKKTAGRPAVRTLGRYHDLAAVFRSVNEEYFEGRISSCITWGARRQRRTSIRKTLGSYSPHSNIIRINPVLDRKAVPAYFVEFIVYHEMLHADVGVSERNGRRSMHPPGFRIREKAFKSYGKATAWEKNYAF